MGKYTKSNWYGRGFTLPGYRYMGPFNSLNRGRPRNRADYAARIHDKTYGKIIGQGRRAYTNFNEADEDMLRSLKGDTSLGGYVARAAFGLKRVVAPHDVQRNVRHKPNEGDYWSDDQKSDVGITSFKKIMPRSIRTDGVSKRFRSKSGGPKGKKSLLKRVRALEGNKAPDTVVHANHSQPIFMNTGSPNFKAYHEIPCLTHTDMDTAIGSINGIDYRTVNSSMKFRNVKLSVNLKCAQTGNVKVKYQFMRCSDSGGISPIDELRIWLVERGLTIATSKGTATAASATTAYIPARQLFNDDELEYPMYSVNTDTHWAPMSKVKTAVIGPGGTFSANQFIKEIIYKPEIQDGNDVAFLKNFDYMCIVVLCGDVVHQQTTNTGLVGYGGWRMEGSFRHTYDIRVSDGAGAKILSYSTGLIDTNLSAPVHADNMVSAIEADAQV